MRCLPFLLVLAAINLLPAQDFSPANTQKALDTLSDDQQVDFILKNYYAIYSADFENAINLTTRAYELSEKSNNRTQQAYAQLYRGVVTYLHGDYEKAFEDFISALKRFETLNDKKGEAATLNEMTVFYSKTKQPEKAWEAIRKAESIALEINDLMALGTSLSHQSWFKKREGDMASAKALTQRVLEIRKQTNDSVGLGYVYLDLAEYAAMEGNMKESYALVAQSTAIRQKLGDKQGVAVNTVIVGENLFTEEKYKEAIRYFEKCIELAKPIGMTDLTRFAYDMIEKSYVALNDFRKAYEFQELAHAYEDSLFNIAKAKTVAELDAKYETEKKEKQIIEQQAEIEQKQLIIQRDRLLMVLLAFVILSVIILSWLIINRMRQKQALDLAREKAQAREAQIQAVIASQERERNRFARDLHDTFGQLISILNINLQSLQNGRATLMKREEVFNTSASVLEDMYAELKNICFDLMPQSLIKGGIEPAITEFAERVTRSGKITLKTDFFGLDSRLSEIQEISLYRICQEWVNNIIKYSDATLVTIQITLHEEELVMLIEDNGSGFDASLLTSGKGNGWRNMVSRSNLIHGELSLDTRLGRKGNTLVLECLHTKIHVDHKAELLST